MEAEKKEVWTIYSVADFKEVIDFGKLVTAEEAKELYMKEQFEDVLDSEVVSIASIVSIDGAGFDD